MTDYLESKLIRQLDVAAVRELQIPGLLLMENAARSACEVLTSRNPSGRIMIVCGPGNNGGDGLAMARLLAANGIGSDVFLIRGGRELTLDARANFEFLQRSGITVMDVTTSPMPTFLSGLTTNDWIVDALLGTGIRGDLRSPFRELVETINRSAAHVLSVDVPTGLDADTGTPCGDAVRANVTVTFVAKKSGFQNADAQPYLGQIEVRHIGIPQHWVCEWCRKQSHADSES